MRFPPGPLYLLQNFPSFAIPSIIVYTCLTLSKKHLNIDIPTWLTVFTVLLARPAFSIFNRYHSRFADSRNAAANNAVLAPRVRESAFSIISKMVNNLKNGYPGTFQWSWKKKYSKPYNYIFLVGDSTRGWANKYGNVFQLGLLTNNRVRLLSLILEHEIRASLQVVTIEPLHIKVLQSSRLRFWLWHSGLPSKAILTTQFDAFEKGKVASK